MGSADRLRALPVCSGSEGLGSMGDGHRLLSVEANQAYWLEIGGRGTVQDTVGLKGGEGAFESQRWGAALSLWNLPQGSMGATGGPEGVLGKGPPRRLARWSGLRAQKQRPAGTSRDPQSLHCAHPGQICCCLLGKNYSLARPVWLSG